MKDALDIHRELLGRDVPHEIIRLPRALAHADEIPELTGLPPEQCAVVRFYLVNEASLVATVTPAGTFPWPGVVLDAIGGVTIEAAGADLVNQVTDYAVTLSAPLLLPPEVPVLLDRVLAQSIVVYTPTGDSGTLLGICTSHLLELTGATVVDLLPAADLTHAELGASVH